MATRRSSRIQDKRISSNKLATQDESDDSNIEVVQARPVRKAKRAKTVGTTKQVVTNANPEVFRRTRGKHGLLEKLAKEAPLDIYLEVFKHLEPRDILHLSRTNKDFRNFLMASSSLSIWREARENVSDLPPLPIDLNEPQYASLLFGNNCYACLRSPCDNVIWECRVRCHKSCMSQLFINYNRIENRPARLNDSDLRNVIAHAPFYFGQIGKNRGRFWFIPMFERLFAKYKEIQRDQSAVRKWNEEKGRRFKLITNHVRQCLIWERKRRAGQERLRKERRQEVIERLSASGWGVEELNHNEFFLHSLLKISKPITERMWSSLEPQLVDLLQTLKDRRLKEERRRSLKSRYELLELAYEEKTCGDGLTVYPPISDFILDANIGVIDDMIWNTPHDQKLTRSDFIDALRSAGAEIAEFSRIWVEQQSQGLTKLMRRHGFKGDYDLGSTIFACVHCGDRTWTPRIFMHRCSTLNIWNNQRRWDRPEFNPLSELSCGWWRAAAFAPDVVASTKLKEIMALCGTVEAERIEDLEREDPLFECLGCKGGQSGKRCFARWMEALMHSLEGDKVVLAILDDDTKSRILALEQGHGRYCPNYVVCKHCPPDKTVFELHSSTDKLWSHLRIEHGIDHVKVKRNVDWCYGLREPVFTFRPRAVTLVG
ncbi:hypothetical protein E1B28_002080 [Marasmius oreades]|uniref:F-box domain-containing protein n=1 Tax=Marasmius oreades TaxID=181124 RepID=A0A9P7RMY7_9AGAR|nr:uncharacterized protein E1B28_002080 [Marasmius oreades]KAG7086121.1 hypothetical protein E1B28_002080 [Marasmius oreades]